MGARRSRMSQSGRARVVITGIGTAQPRGQRRRRFLRRPDRGQIRRDPARGLGRGEQLQPGRRPDQEPQDRGPPRRQGDPPDGAVHPDRDHRGAQALAQAGVDLMPSENGSRPDGLDPDRIGVSNGTSLGSFTDIYQQILSGGPKHERVSPFFVPGSCPTWPAPGWRSSSVSAATTTPRSPPARPARSRSATRFGCFSTATPTPCSPAAPRPTSRTGASPPSAP